jgi:hypothetical protein
LKLHSLAILLKSCKRKIYIKYIPIRKFGRFLVLVIPKPMKTMRRVKKKRRRARKMILQPTHREKRDSSGREKQWPVGAERLV